MSPFFVSRYGCKRTPIAVPHHRWRLSPLMLLIILFAALCAAYVWQMTTLSMRGYLYSTLSQQRAALQEELQQSHFAALERQSLARVEERLAELHFVRDAKTEYVTREELRLSVSQR